jgi:DNA-binding CsgD family transcriptional regulator
MELAGKIADDDAATYTEYHLQKARLAGAFGKMSEAFETFERAVVSAKESPNVADIIRVWTAYVWWAEMSGDNDLIARCIENALLVARKHGVVAKISYFCLEYARHLSCIGLYGAAHHYLSEALSYNVYEPTLDMTFARVGIPIALRMKDESILESCARLPALELAFRIGRPDGFAGVAAAFSQWHAANGRERKAQALIHRVIENVRTRLDHIWIFPIAAARYGVLSDMPHVREMLATTDAALLHSDLTQACLSLFDALVADRHKMRPEARCYAESAIERFTRLGWYGYVDLLRELIVPDVSIRHDPAKEPQPLAHMLAVLSAREKQVVELVLKGYTNRAISETLAIKERTVETHMTAIMGHLGVRSRNQLMARLIHDQIK